MNVLRFDERVKRSIERYRNEPTWQRAVGNFGFGFVFIGALTNLLLFVIGIAAKVGTHVIYDPWWPTYVAVSSLAGLYWAIRGRRRPRS